MKDRYYPGATKTWQDVELSNGDMFFLQNNAGAAEMPEDQRIQLMLKLQKDGQVTGEGLTALGIDAGNEADYYAAYLTLAYKAAQAGMTYDDLDTAYWEEKVGQAVAAALARGGTRGPEEGFSGGTPKGKMGAPGTGRPVVERAAPASANKQGGGNKGGLSGLSEDAPVEPVKTVPGLRSHVIEGDSVPGQAREIKGAHNKNAFDKYANDISVVSRKPHPNYKGVEVVVYRIPARDKAGNVIPGVYKSETYRKTIYDPSVMSDEQFHNGGLEAVADAKAAGRLSRQWTGYSKDGTRYRGYTNANGEVTSFFIDSDTTQ